MCYLVETNTIQSRAGLVNKFSYENNMVHSVQITDDHITKIQKLLARNPQAAKCESWQIQLNASHDEIAQLSFPSDFSTNDQAGVSWKIF